MKEFGSAVRRWYLVTWIFAFADFEQGVLCFWDYISGVDYISVRSCLTGDYEFKKALL